MPLTQDASDQPLFSQALADRVQALANHVAQLSEEDLMNPSTAGKLQVLAAQGSLPGSARPSSDRIPAVMPGQKVVGEPVHFQSSLYSPGQPADPPSGMRSFHKLRRRSSLSVASMPAGSTFLYNREPDPRNSASMRMGHAGLPVPGDPASAPAGFGLGHSSGLIRWQTFEEEAWIGSEGGRAEAELNESGFDMSTVSRSTQSTVAPPPNVRDHAAAFSVTKALEDFSHSDAIAAPVPRQVGSRTGQVRRASISHAMQWPSPSMTPFQRSARRASTSHHDVNHWPAAITSPPQGAAGGRVQPLPVFPGSYNGVSGDYDPSRGLCIRRSITLDRVPTQWSDGGIQQHEPASQPAPVRRARTVSNLRVQALTSCLKSGSLSNGDAVLGHDSSDGQSDEYERQASCTSGYEESLLYPELQLPPHVQNPIHLSKYEDGPDGTHLQASAFVRASSDVWAGDHPMPPSVSTLRAAAPLGAVYRRHKTEDIPIKPRSSRQMQQHQPIIEESLADMMSSHQSQMFTSVQVSPTTLWMLIIGASALSGLLLLNTLVIVQAVLIMQQGRQA